MVVKHNSPSDLDNDQLGDDPKVVLELHAAGCGRRVTLKRFEGDDGIHQLTEAARTVATETAHGNSHPVVESVIFL